MKKKFLALLTALSLGLTGGLTGCGGAASGSGAPAAVQKITPEQAYARMQSGDEITILDVRTEDEYNEAHIPGAVLLPNEDIGTERPAQLPDLNAELLVYCRSGRRSAQAAEKLANLGYSNVSDFGGIQSWPYETVAE